MYHLTADSEVVFFFVHKGAKCVRTEWRKMVKLHFPMVPSSM